MKNKKCNKCNLFKKLDSFSIDRSHNDGRSSICRKCRNLYGRVYYSKNKEKRAKSGNIYYKKNKQKILISNKAYRDNNKQKISEYRKQYYIVNKEKINNYREQNRQKALIQAKKYRQSNKKELSEKRKLYTKYNKEKKQEYDKKYLKGWAKFKSYKDSLTIDESPRLAADGISLEVRCKYCNKYFISINQEVKNRIKVLNGIGGGQFIYCSDGCKEVCPIYGQIKYPKGFKKSSSREVNPFIRQRCFKRDDWKCQICGKFIDEAPLHCHHIEGVAQNPRLSNDVENTVTLCKTCHKEVHKLPGCNYYELRCNSEGR